MVDGAAKELAFRQGQRAALVTGEASQSIFNPYDQDDEPELYEAWDDGFNWDSDIKGEMAHFGV